MSEEAIAGRLSVEQIEELLLLAKKVEKTSSSFRYKKSHPFNEVEEIKKAETHLETIIEERKSSA